MIIFEKRAAIKAFYYLMAVDGTVSADEIECFDAIGSELDPDDFPAYRNAIIEECEAQLNNVIDEDDHYDVVMEGMDKALASRIDDPEQGVTLRLLVWNMLVIAFSNQDYSSVERRLIKHIVRITDMDRSIFLEMEQIIKTNAAVESERHWIAQSNRPYSEIRPIADELERRQKVVLSCARQLIEDELFDPIEKASLPANGLYVGAADAMKKLGRAVKTKTTELGGKTVETTRSVFSGISKRTKGLFGGKKASNGEDSPEAEEDISSESAE